MIPHVVFSIIIIITLLFLFRKFIIIIISIHITINRCVGKTIIILIVIQTLCTYSRSCSMKILLYTCIDD